MSGTGSYFGRIGQYELRGILGRGGMATVYRAYQPSLDREVAIKVVSVRWAQDPVFRERFTREARMVARLRHPHILDIYDFGEENGATYLVTELIAGGTLQERLGRPLPLTEIARIARQIGDALDYAHGQGLLHRDVKPANIFLDGPARAVLADFGIAKTVGQGNVTSLTKTGTGVGTPEYMAPEQALNEPVDARADLYSLAVVLYEALTGATPYEASTPLETLQGHIRGALPDPRQHNPALSPRITDVLVKALARQPRDRYRSGKDLADALDAAIAASASEPPPPADRAARTAMIDARAGWREPIAETQIGPRPERLGSETVAHLRPSEASLLLPPLPDLYAQGQATLPQTPSTPEAGPPRDTPSSPPTPPPAANAAARERAPTHTTLASPPGQPAPLAGAYSQEPATGQRRTRANVALWAALAGAMLLLLLFIGGGGIYLWRDGAATPTPAATAAVAVTSPTSGRATATVTATSPPTIASGAATATAAATADPALPRIQAGDTALRDGNFTEALARYREALAINPNSALANRQLGHTLWVWNHEAGEIDYLDKATKLAPQDALAWAYLSFSAVDTYQSERAYAAAQQAVALDPNLAEGFAAIANCYVRYNPNPASPEDGHRQAQRAIDRARTLAPDNLWVLWFESQVLLAREQHQEALVPMDRAIAQRPKWPTLYYGKGGIYRGMKRYAEARAEQQRALALDPDYPFANTEMGWLAYQDGDYDGARPYFEKALALTDIDISAHNGLGFVLYQQKDYNNALLHFQRSIGIEPRGPIGYEGLGYVQLGLQRHDEAFSAFRKVIDLRPYWENGYVGVAFTHAARQQYAEAEAVLRANLDRVKEPAGMHFWLGWTIYQQRKYAESVPEFERATQLDDQVADYHYWLGAAYEQVGRYGDARAAWERTLALEPKHPRAKDGIDRLNRLGR